MDLTTFTIMVSLTAVLVAALTIQVCLWLFDYNPIALAWFAGAIAVGLGLAYQLSQMRRAK